MLFRSDVGDFQSIFKARNVVSELEIRREKLVVFAIETTFRRSETVLWFIDLNSSPLRSLFLGKTKESSALHTIFCRDL